jgi:signal transduction histidine kinase
MAANHHPTMCPAAPSRLWIACVVAAGVAAVALAGAGAPPGQRFERGLFALLVVGLPALAGLNALRAPGGRRFGIALLVMSAASALSALAETSASVPYTVGRMAGWVATGIVYVLVLVFPAGQPTRRFERALAIGIVAAIAIGTLGAAFVTEPFTAHTPWATCTDCPANAALLGREPAAIDDIVIPLRELALAVLLLGVAISLARRWRSASALRRRMLVPVAIPAIALAVTHIAFFTALEAGAAPAAIDLLGDLWGVCIAAVTAAFVYVLIRRRLLLAELENRLTRTDAAELPDALADSLSDPGVTVLWRAEADGPWWSGDGRAVSEPQASPGRVVSVLPGEDGAALALVHDVRLRDDEELLIAAGSLALAGWTHERAASGLVRATAALAESRRRIAEAAEAERARIGRNLHDGAQQRLIALGTRLALAEELLWEDPVAGVRTVHQVRTEIDAALEEIRAYARGAFPGALQEHGLETALRTLARDAPMPVHVSVAGLSRQPLQIESTIYLVCAEALQNAMKHARATNVWIDVSQDRQLGFTVRDDGVGFVADPHNAGRGLRHIRDRVSAVGGDLAICSSPGEGTRVTATVSLEEHEGGPDAPLSFAAHRARRLRARRVYDRELAATAETVSRTRRELDAVLQSLGVAGPQRADIALLLGEATANAVLHAYPDSSPGQVRVIADLRGLTLGVSIADSGCGMPARHATGLGVTLMRRLADELEIVPGPSGRGTTVRATFENVIDAARPDAGTVIRRARQLHAYARSVGETRSPM